MVPVDTDTYRPLPPDNREVQERYILSVGRTNDPRKNIPMLLEAFSKILAHDPGLKLVLAGDEPAAPLLDHCDQLGIAESVDFRGTVSDGELVTLYQHADLFVIASAQEGLGIVMLEAMACGLPVVATDCGGPEGIVIDGETGQIVPNNDPDALADAIVAMLSQPDHLERLREQCVAFIRQNCTRQAVERKLYEHFAAAFPNSEAARRNPRGTD
jgi:glycosyltransferase involved in cell wall biosynthesis